MISKTIRSSTYIKYQKQRHRRFSACGVVILGIPWFYIVNVNSLGNFLAIGALGTLFSTGLPFLPIPLSFI